MKNKKIYSQPVLVSEQFVPQEYVASCWGLQCNVSGQVYHDYSPVGTFGPEDTEWYENTAHPDVYRENQIFNSSTYPPKGYTPAIIGTIVKDTSHHGHGYQPKDTYTATAYGYSNGHHFSSLGHLVSAPMETYWVGSIIWGHEETKKSMS
jgi:hypothetical protein